MVTILKQELSGFSFDSTYGAYAYGVNPHPFTLVLGDTYTVTWDGVAYECVSQDMSAINAGCIALGDLSSFGGSGNGEPFVIAWIPGGVTCFSFAEGESHAVEIQAHSNVIYSAQGIALTDGGAEVAVCGLVVGEEYVVTINDIEYTLTAKGVSSEDGLSISYVGNMGIVDSSVYEDTGEDFVFYEVISVRAGVVIYLSASTVDLTITIAEEAEPIGIILKNYYGEEVAHYGLETVSFKTTDGGKATFTLGEKTQAVVDADFSEGNQVVQAGDGELYDQVTIKKPENLLPENIRNGETVAGVAGGFIGDTEEVTVDLAMADGDQVITPSAEGKVLSQVTITKPETLVPENIVSGVDIGGVVGNVSVPESEETNVTLDFSGGDMEISPDEGKAFSKVNIPKPETLLAENIAEGVNIAGIIGTLAAGVGDSGIKVVGGTFVPTSKQGYVFTHNLGVIPDLVLFKVTYTPTSNYVTIAFGLSDAFCNKYGAGSGLINFAYVKTSSGVNLSAYTVGIEQTSNTAAVIHSANEKTLTFGTGANLYTNSTYGRLTYLIIGGLV